MTDLQTFPISLSVLQRCQLQREGVYPPHLRENCSEQENIVTGHLEHEPKLEKATTTEQGLSIWTSGDERATAQQQ